MDATASNSDQLDEVETAPSPAAIRSPATRMTRLLSARVYLFGVMASVPALFNITRPMFQARDPGVGFDRRVVLFHALQSLVLSLLFALPVLFWLWGPSVSPEEGYGVAGWVGLGLALFKVGVFNPAVARSFFSQRHEHRTLRIAGIAALVDGLLRWLLPRHDVEEANASYFKGDRPFTGYGTEINAWTLVIDTSAPVHSVHDFAGASHDPLPIDTADLYRAIVGCTAAMRVENLEINWHTFLKGSAANKLRKLIHKRFARPPQRLSPQFIDELDREGDSGRRYMVLQMEKADQDLITTQFVRFQANGKLIFCEFASYVLAPGLKRLNRLDWYFEIQSLVYLCFGVALTAWAAVWAIALTFAIGVGVPALGLVDNAAAYWQVPGAMGIGLLGFAKAPGSILLSLSFVTVIIVAFPLAWRALRAVLSVLGLLTMLTREFGAAFSYRERFTSRGNLDYYCLQDVARFMKTQEKILIKAICEKLHDHGIDASDFKESLTAYVNQGVINSGDIRGNVMTSVKGFVFRRPARAAANRSKRKVANG